MNAHNEYIVCYYDNSTSNRFTENIAYWACWACWAYSNTFFDSFNTLATIWATVLALSNIVFISILMLLKDL